jgi:hypothetical protein
MALGDYLPTPIETPDGKQFRLEVAAAEPRAGIAALNAMDGQECPDDADAFEEWCAATTPVQLLADLRDPEEPFRVHVLSDRGTWDHGHSAALGPGPRRPRYPGRSAHRGRHVWRTDRGRRRSTRRRGLVVLRGWEVRRLPSRVLGSAWLDLDRILAAAGPEDNG